MKLTALTLAIILALALLSPIGSAAKANSDNSTVDLTVEVVLPPTDDDVGGGGILPVYYSKTDLFGVGGQFLISYKGRILRTIEATTEDGMLTFTIPRGTIALGENGRRLRGLEVVVDENPPKPSLIAVVIITGLAYAFGPEGATFEPPILFTWSYVPEDLPDDIAEEDLVIVSYLHSPKEWYETSSLKIASDEDSGEWVELPSIVDPINNNVTTLVTHFTTFALVGTVVPLVVPVVPVEPEPVVEEPELTLVPSPAPVPVPVPLPVTPETPVVEPEQVVPPVTEPSGLSWILVAGSILAGLAIGVVIVVMLIKRWSKRT